MTPDILLLFGALAVTGPVSPTEALAGFSNPAGVTFVCIRLLAIDRSMNTFFGHLFGFLELRYTRYEKFSV